MGTEQKNLDVPLKVTGKTVYGIDVKLPGMKWAAVKSCPVYGGKVKSYDFERIRNEPGVISAIEFPIPDPALIRGRIFGGGVAVIADSWYQAKTAIDKMPIEWDVPPQERCTQYRQHTGGADGGPGQARQSPCQSRRLRQRLLRRRQNRRSDLLHALSPARPDGARKRDGACHATTASTSGSATRARRRRATRPPRSPAFRKRTSISICAISAAAIGRNGNGPQAEQAIYIANQNRGTPIHLLWTREEDFINTTYRSMGVARLRAALDADGWPIAIEVRTATDEEAPGATAGFDMASRYFAPNYRFSTHTAALPHSRGHAARRRRAGPHFYRESFMDELAHAAGKDPYLYRRELISRTNLPYKADMIKALDTAAEMSGWGTPLPQGTARAIALEERGAEAGSHATISALVHTVSISKQGEVRLMRVDVAHEEGFGLVNPLSVRKQIEGQIVWFYNDAMYQECNVTEGRIAENNFDTFLLSRINEDPPEINITFFKTGHWLDGMGHDRGTSIQSGIADAVFQITGKRYRDLPLRNHDLTWS